jgi:hypothetical protein
MKYGLDATSPGEGTIKGSCECGHESKEHLKGEEFVEQMSDCRFLTEEAILWR